MDFFLILLMILSVWLVYRFWTRLFQTRGYRDRQRRKYARDLPPWYW